MQAMKDLKDIKRKEFARRGALIFTMLSGASLIVGAAVVSWMIWAIGAGILFGAMALLCLVASRSL